MDCIPSFEAIYIIYAVNHKSNYIMYVKCLNLIIYNYM